MFSTTNIVSNKSEFTSRFKFGQNDNCRFQEFEYGVMENGTEYVDAKFTQLDESGNVIAEDKKRIFAPDMDHVVQGKTLEQSQQQAIQRSIGHLKYICDILSGKELIADAPTFKAFVERTIAFTKGNKQMCNVPCRILLQYDKNGKYPQFPDYQNYLEVQVDGEPTRLKFSKWQLENRCTKSADEPSAGGTDIKESTTNIDDLF